MPVQFVLGRAGSGKTRYLIDRMVEIMQADPLGPPIYWLLPRQATFQAERLLTVTQGGFSRIRVVSFDLLGKEILTHCGDVGIPEITTIGRRMVIGHLLRGHQKQLKFYASSAHRRGLAAELDSTFGEFERAGLDVPAMDILLNTMQADDRTAPYLRDKLADLHLLQNAYNQYIGQEKLDPQRRLSLVLKRMDDCSLLKEAQLFVDDFYDFSAHERRLLTGIAGAVRQTTIALAIDPDSEAVKNPAGLLTEFATFHRTERTYRALQNAFGETALRMEKPVLLNGSYRSMQPDLVALERTLFTGVAINAPVTSISAIEAPDARSEVDAVARRIKAAVAEGTRYRQIGVMVRDMAGYQEIINASFREHGLPYFADQRRTAAHHPLLQMVRAALQIARHHWPHDAVMTLIKTGLAGLNDDQADELENYVLQHRIRNRMWESTEPWAFTRELIVAEDEFGLPVLSESAKIDSFRRSLVEKLSPILTLKKQSTVREIAASLFMMLDAFGVRLQLRQWMQQAEAENRIERRDEHEQVWSEFSQLFDHMVDLLGDEPITLVDFIDVLDSGLESFDLALIPVTVDQILVGQLDRTRAPELKIVFVLGLNEGTFPYVQKERCVISDRERRTLRQRNIDLDPDTERRLLDERFLAYLAFTRPSQELIISRFTAHENGHKSNPSTFWTEMLRVAPDLSVEMITRISRDDADTIGTPRQLISSLMRWVREGALPDEKKSALYQWLIISAQTGNVRQLQQQAWGALRYTNTAELNQLLTQSLFTSPLQANIRQIETMAECPFKHFARYGLRLHSREQEEITGIDLSNAYHHILENLVSDCLAGKKDWCMLKPADAHEMVRQHATEIGRRLRGELMLSTARNRFMLDRIERNLEQAIAAMTEMHRRGYYRPAIASLRFGKNGSIPAYEVTTPSGAKVQLHGQIDRVDLNTRKTGFVVADYKLASGGLPLDRVFHGLSLQLLTSLLVVQANGQQLAGGKLIPAAAFLLQLLRSPQTVDHPSEGILPEDPNFHLRVKPRGLINQRAIKSLDRQLESGASPVMNVSINQDGNYGRQAYSDDAEEDEFEALLKHVEKRIGELTDEILSGNVSVAPYMINRKTPCSRCEFRSVCRFEPGVNRYRHLDAMKKQSVLDEVRKGE